jgi:hypothetical protein
MKSVREELELAEAACSEALKSYSEAKSKYEKSIDDCTEAKKISIDRWEQELDKCNKMLISCYDPMMKWRAAKVKVEKLKLGTGKP